MTATDQTIEEMMANAGPLLKATSMDLAADSEVRLAAVTLSEDDFEVWIADKLLPALIARNARDARNAKRYLKAQKAGETHALEARIYARIRAEG